MANVVATKIDDHGMFYWIFFEHGDIERPVLILADPTLRGILEREGYEMVRKKAGTREEQLEGPRNLGIGVIMPDKIDFTVTRTDDNKFVLSYTEHFDKLPPEMEEKLESAIEATVALQGQIPGLKVERRERGLFMETAPMKCEEVLSCLISEVVGMNEGMIDMEKLSKVRKAVQQIFEG